MDKREWEGFVNRAKEGGELKQDLHPEEFSDFTLSGGSDMRVEPFDLQPSVYLSYAKEELDLESDRGNLESVASSKRAVHCQLDTILVSLGFLDKIKSNFPAKLDILRHCGVLAPSILERLNHVRNFLEHDYRRVDRREARELYDIATLFVEATSRFISEVTLAKGDLSLTAAINAEKGELLIRLGSRIPWKPKPGQKMYYKLVSRTNYEEYAGWLRLVMHALRTDK